MMIDERNYTCSHSEKGLHPLTAPSMLTSCLVSSPLVSSPDFATQPNTPLPSILSPPISSPFPSGPHLSHQDTKQHLQFPRTSFKPSLPPLTEASDSPPGSHPHSRTPSRHVRVSSPYPVCRNASCVSAVRGHVESSI